VSGQGPQRRPVFDPLIDGAIARRAGKSDLQIAQEMHAAGLASPTPPRGVDAVIESSARGEIAAYKKLTPRERNEAFFAAQAEARQAQEEVSSSKPARLVKVNPFIGKSSEEIAQLDQQLAEARESNWWDEREVEEQFAADPLWNDQDDDDELDDDYQEGA
jgi:hypothetical protein